MAPPFFCLEIIGLINVSHPISSMHGGFTFIWFIFMVHVMKYPLHGCQWVLNHHDPLLIPERGLISCELRFP